MSSFYRRWHWDNTIYKWDVPSIQLKVIPRHSVSSREVDRLSLPFIDLYVPALTPWPPQQWCHTGVCSICNVHVSKSKSELCYDQWFSQPVCLGIKHPSVAYDWIFITVRQLQVCWCGALSLMRGQVCHLPDSVSSNTSLVSMYNLHVTSY
jgi:hypothetical protein